MLSNAMNSLLLGLVASLAAPVSGTFVIQCYSRLFDERADPVVDPGKASNHVHAIAGGNGFNFTMNYDQARASKCSTCNVKEDLSNYWTPKMYYHAKNGSFINVPINGDTPGGDMGGQAIYYLTRSGPDNDKLVAFPPGFRMLAGDPNKRNYTSDFAGLAVSHKCIGNTNEQYSSLPPVKCPGGVRAQVTFPSCWDGVNLDSPDHKSHVVYPKDGNYDGGRCPASHPKHLVTLFYEVYYSTQLFENEWWSDKQPFVFSNGDPTGYGFHGDFVNGWDIPTLQRAVTDCVDGTPNCPSTHFTFRDQGETQACKLPSQINEQVNGILSALPGCNPITPGPAAAVPVSNCPVTKITGPTAASLGYTDLTKSKGWKYIGCGVDNAGSRTLNAAQTSGNSMTIETCVDFCKSKGTKYAGLEYSGECYCGNSIAADRAPQAGVLGNCLMKCSGNANEICGGAAAISLYQACAGGACTNSAKKRSRRLAAAERVKARIEGSI